ncbi:hypothetical protein ACWGB8_08210 [Kitasatospora sp. NPDC054939]
MDESQSGEEVRHTAAGGAVRLLRAAREWLGWIVVAAGAALCVLGWYGISGEHRIEQQLPLLASATVPGAALIVSGTVLVALRPFGPGPGPGRGPSGADGATDRRVEQLYALLVEPESGPGSGPAPVPADAPEPGTSPQPERSWTHEAARAEDPAPQEDPAHTDERSRVDDPAHADGGADGTAAPAAAPPATNSPLSVPGGTFYHRPDCPLIAGKDLAAPVDPQAVRNRGLTPCRLCDPAPPPTPDAPKAPDDPATAEAEARRPPEAPDAPSHPQPPDPPEVAG